MTVEQVTRALGLAVVAYRAGEITKAEYDGVWKHYARVLNPGISENTRARLEGGRV